MPRHARLMDVHPGHEVVDGLFSCEQCFDDPEPTRVGERLKRGELHGYVYVCHCAYICVKDIFFATGVSFDAEPPSRRGCKKMT